MHARRFTSILVKYQKDKCHTILRSRALRACLRLARLSLWIFCRCTMVLMYVRHMQYVSVRCLFHIGAHAAPTVPIGCLQHQQWKALSFLPYILFQVQGVNDLKVYIPFTHVLVSLTSISHSFIIQFKGISSSHSTPGKWICSPPAGLSHWE